MQQLRTWKAPVHHPLSHSHRRRHARNTCTCLRSTDDGSSEGNLFLLKKRKLAALILFLKLKNKSRRRWWIRPGLKSGYSHGEFNRVVELEKCDNEWYLRYMRMSPEAFYHLLSLVQHDLTRANTNFRKSIPSSVQLAITLRYLAHGYSMIILAIIFKVGHLRS